jgi:hypothetical protein
MERVSSIPMDRVRAEIGRVVERLLDERVPMNTVTAMGETRANRRNRG